MKKNLLLWELESLDSSIRCEFFANSDGDNFIRIHSIDRDEILELNNGIPGNVPKYNAIYGIMRLWKDLDLKADTLTRTVAPNDQDDFFHQDMEAYEEEICNCIRAINLICF